MSRAFEAFREGRVEQGSREQKDVTGCFVSRLVADATNDIEFEHPLFKH